MSQSPQNQTLTKGDTVWVECGLNLFEPAKIVDLEQGWVDTSKDEEVHRSDGVLVRYILSRTQDIVPPDGLSPVQPGSTTDNDHGGRKSRRSRRTATVEKDTSMSDSPKESDAPTPFDFQVEEVPSSPNAYRAFQTKNKRSTTASRRSNRVTPSPKTAQIKTESTTLITKPTRIAKVKERPESMEIDSPAESAAKLDATSKKLSSPYFSSTTKSEIKQEPDPVTSSEMNGAKKNKATSQKKVASQKNGKATSQKKEKFASQKKEKVASQKDGKEAIQKKGKAKKKIELIRIPKDDGSDVESVASSESEDDDPYYNVGYAPSGRASCRGCDTIIGKGEVRVSSRPLFRGKPGFTVYRHLKCQMFDPDMVTTMEDVAGWDRLKPEEKNRLKKRIVDSKKEAEEEQEEMQPDELVQTQFSGEMRPNPPPGWKDGGVTPLPFQVEGYSWMYQQEQGKIRGGILADEMGMGKTLQTIATIVGNKPLLQHASVKAKHAPDAHDLEARMKEENLWCKATKEWHHENDMQNIIPQMIPKKNPAARAGTLVVCPVIALLQWKSEIEKFTEEGFLKVGIYHGPKRVSEMPATMLRKYDVVLTTYQCLEQDFRKMINPNKVACPNCGMKFKIDKLKVHLKYFCGENARRTEAQSRQRRSSNHRGGPGGGRRGNNNGGSSKKGKKGKKEPPLKKAKTMTPSPRKSVKVKRTKEYESESELSEIEMVASASRPSRSAGKVASKQLSASVKDWVERGKGNVSENEESNYEDEEFSDDFSLDEGEDDPPIASWKGTKKTIAKKSSQKKRLISKMTPSDDETSDDESDDDSIERARSKQRKALAASKKKGKSGGKKGKGNKKGKGKRLNDDSSTDSDDSDEDPLKGIDMEELLGDAMSGAKFSLLHSVCWWRIILDEAHYIKSRSSQTAAAAFALTSIHRWALSGTPLQNRVGELYSLIRFLRLDPMAYYFCKCKGCNCKSLHYRMKEGVCQDCGHRAFTHFAHFNKHVLNVIQREGYAGDGRRAMFKLRDLVLHKCMIRRTKETRAEDMNLPPRIVSIRTIKLHPIEEDFYNALYTETRSSFDDYVTEGTLLNNYAHIFDLLTKMRQAVDHPYLIVFSKNNKLKNLKPQGTAAANGSIDCCICHEPPTDRILSSCCKSGFCRTCVAEYIESSAGETTPCPSCERPFSIDLNQAAVETVPDDGQMAIDSSTVPQLKTLSHVQTGSILRRINLAEFATSSKIEVLVSDLIQMRTQRPGSKALVFSQFVNMLDLIRWRLHSDPCLAHMGLGVRILHGGMDVKSRDTAIKEFQSDPNVRVLLMSLKAGGVALNLTVASEVFLVDNWWNPAAEMQAIDRTHRLGQHRPIRATRYICEGTVEERVLQLQEKKRLVFDGTVGQDAGSLKMLNVSDMKALFT